MQIRVSGKTSRNINAACRLNENVTSHSDTALAQLLKTMGDSRNTWSSTELYRIYTKDGGTLSRRYLIQKVSEYFGDELVVLSAVGLANIIMFKSHASSLMYMEAEDDDDPISVAKIAKKIAQEVKEIHHAKGKYKSKIDFDIASEDSCPTLSFLLSEISSTLRQSLPSLLIQNIVTNCTGSLYRRKAIDRAFV